MLNATELKELISEIKERSMDAGIIMIEGELAARNLYASRSAISEALTSVDPVGASLRWKDLTPRVIYSVPSTMICYVTYYRSLSLLHKVIHSEKAIAHEVRPIAHVCHNQQPDIGKNSNRCPHFRIMRQQSGLP